MASAVVRVALAGLGSVGLPTAEALLSGKIPGMRLTAVSASTPDSALQKLASIGSPSSGVTACPVGELAQHAEVIVEGLPPKSFMEAAEPALAAGKALVALSVTQVLQHPELEDLAIKTGGRMYACCPLSIPMPFPPRPSVADRHA